MNCIQCEGVVEPNDKKLLCIDCGFSFHLRCVDNIKEEDYDFIISNQVNWKCHMCDKKKTTRGDATPVTPSGSKIFNIARGGGSEADSDSSTTLVSGVSKKIICQLCKKGFSYNAHKATCVKCTNNFHYKCVGVDKKEFSKIEINWSCQACINKGKPSESESGGTIRPTLLSISDKGSKVSSQESKDITLMDILNEMRAFRMEIHETNKEFREQMEKYSEWIIENGQKIEEVGKQINQAHNDISILYQENVNLKKEVKQCKVKIENLEQSCKDNVVEISGVPYKEKENLLSLVTNISKVIGFVFKEEMIDNIYRYRSSIVGRPGIIVVCFVRKLDKEAFVNKRRIKRNVNSRDVGFMEGDATVIYINECLTQDRRKLLNEARTARKEKQYTYLWVRNGRIYLRKNQGDPVVTIDSIEDINKLI